MLKILTDTNGSVDPKYYVFIFQNQSNLCNSENKPVN